MIDNRFDKFFEGFELNAYKLLGSHKKDNGVEFTVWAPNAYKVQVLTSKDWTVFYDLKKIDDRGIWQVFVEDMDIIYAYRYRLFKDEKTFHDKSDPYAYAFERRPNNASCMYDLDYYKYSDDKYLSQRTLSYDKPFNIYEVHLNGFKKEGEFASYQQIKKDLIPYVKEMGYSHIELMPISEHPFDGSWGYQSTGFYGATSRYGTPYDLMDLINECHLNGIGVLLDVVYVHFATDSFALKEFDFGHCYESNAGKTEWDTYNFDFGKGAVISFLMSSANFYLKEYHFDGLRFDAVSHFIYPQGNSDRGLNENGISFIKRLNFHIKQAHPTCVMIAEDSSAYGYVTKPVEYGGLGFDYKWDLGWMNDTLKYYKLDPVYRKYHHNSLTFSMAYFYSERFILPFSHDEVVHSKGTIIDKMWGSYEDKFKQCRNLFTYMYTHPGKKLNFMGNELALFREFDERKELDWFMLDYPLHDSFKRMCKDLNGIYNAHPAFWKWDYECDDYHFKWIDADNADQSIYSYYRQDDENCFVCIFNMTPCQYEDFKVNVPYSGQYVEVFNSEKDIYSGCNMCNFTPVRAEIKKVKKETKRTISVRVAPFSAIILKVKKRAVKQK